MNSPNARLSNFQHSDLGPFNTFHRHINNTRGQIIGVFVCLFLTCATIHSFYILRGETGYVGTISSEHGREDIMAYVTQNERFQYGWLSISRDVASLLTQRVICLGDTHDFHS